MKGRVTNDTLVHHYKVEMMEGPQQGRVHRYLKENVTLAPPPAKAVPTAAPPPGTEGRCDVCSKLFSTKEAASCQGVCCGQGLIILAVAPAAAAATGAGVADDPNAVADDPATATGVSEIVENSNAASDVASAAGTGEEAPEWSDFQL